MRLLAISDLHLDYRINREAVDTFTEHPDDWLIIGGDIFGGFDKAEDCFTALQRKFGRVIWVPGNHELWVMGTDKAMGIDDSPAKYGKVVELCRRLGVVTPEDPFVRWEGKGGPHYIVPLFLLYDYSFRPDEVSEEGAIAWAREEGLRCTDEDLIHPGSFGTKQAWCQARLEQTRQRLDELDQDIPWVMINHFPLRYDLVRLHRIPRFSIWCGTTLTEDWHDRYPADVVVSGHLHMRATDYRGGVRFEEVSLGYPRHWQQEKGIDHYLREILPGPAPWPAPDAGPFWRF